MEPCHFAALFLFMVTFRNSQRSIKDNFVSCWSSFQTYSKLPQLK